MKKKTKAKADRRAKARAKEIEKNKADPHCCLECGDERVRQVLWVTLNTNNVEDDEGFGSASNGGLWCPTCEINEIVIVRKSVRLSRLHAAKVKK